MSPAKRFFNPLSHIQLTLFLRLLHFRLLFDATNRRIVY